MTTRRQRDDGFTLIELLVVIIIIGILSAIAIPTFLSQRQKGYRTAALSDMRNVAVALETYATDHEGDYSGLSGATQTSAALNSEGFHPTEWVSFSIVADAKKYCILGVNEKVPGKQFVLRSNDGKIGIELMGSSSC